MRSGGVLYLVLLAGLLALVSGTGACIVAGTKGCTPWRPAGAHTECRECPSFRECKTPIEGAVEWPADASTNLIWPNVGGGGPDMARYNPACGAFLDAVPCPHGAVRVVPAP